MSERINVDHAFDPEARQAQAEFDAYMESRPYKDEGGRVHNPENGQFAKYDEYMEAARSDHYDATLAEGDYSGESLEQLARRVARARAEGDKTRAMDAEEAFFAKFTEYSDKYGWEKEDGSADGPHVDQNAKLGRTTIDDRLERYTKIMYGEDGSVPSTNTTTEASTGGTSPDLTINPEILMPRIDPAELPPAAPAREGESLEEYESRQGVDPSLRIDPPEMPILMPNMGETDPQELMATDDAAAETDTNAETSDATDDNEPERSSGEGSESTNPENETIASKIKNWSKRARDAVNGGLTKLYYGIGWTMNGLARNEYKEGETEQEYNERMKRNGRRAAIGIAAVAVAYGAYRLYHGIETGTGGGNGGSGTTGNHGGNGVDLGGGNRHGGDAHQELLGSKAWNIPKGSGGEALMNRLGVDKHVWYDHQNEFLKRFPHEAYRMPDGNVGFDDPGRLSKGAIKFWAQYARK